MEDAHHLRRADVVTEVLSIEPVELRESLLLRWRYDRQASQFEISLNPARKERDGRRFVRLRFSSVDDFTRNFGLYHRSRLITDEYSSDFVDPNAVVLQYFDLTTNGRNTAQFDFGPSFGSVRFHYENMHVDERYGWPIAQDSTIYRDLDTSETFDYRSPFTPSS